MTAFCLILTATQASAAQLLVPPPGTDNLEFRFAPGKCSNAITVKAAGVPDTTTTVVTTYGCSQSVKTFTFASSGPFDGLQLFGVVPAGSPETVGRSTLALVDAYWTSGPAFAESVFPGGASNYVVVTSVPEPGTWAILLAGAGVLGMAMRRRRAPSPAPRSPCPA